MKNNVKDAVVFLSGSYGDVKKQASTIHLPKCDVVEAIAEVKEGSVQQNVLNLLLLSSYEKVTTKAVKK